MEQEKIVNHPNNDFNDRLLMAYNEVVKEYNELVKMLAVAKEALEKIKHSYGGAYIPKIPESGTISIEHLPTSVTFIAEKAIERLKQMREGK